MKKIRYSAGMKAAVLVAHQCLVTILVLCVTMLILLYSQNIFNFEDKRNTPYDETNYFTEQFKNAAEDIMVFTNLRRKFEINGTYNADKEVDIWQYYENQEIPEHVAQAATQESLSYRLGDLIEWSKGYSTQELELISEYSLEDNSIHQRLSILRDGESVFNEEKTIKSLGDFAPELRRQIIEQTEYNYGGSYTTSLDDSGWAIVKNDDMPANTDENSTDLATSEDEEVSYRVAHTEDEQNDIIDKIMKGHLFELNEKELQWLLEDLDMSYGTASSGYECVYEEFSPVDGTTIWDNFLHGNYSLDHMQNAYLALEFALENIGNEASRYRKGVNRYNQSADMTNIYYWVRGKERNVYTNIEDSNGLNLPEFGQKLGRYMLYREKDSHLETNVKGMNEFFYDRIEPLYVTKGSVLFIGVDTTFPHEDSFRQSKQEYSRMNPWIRICIWGAAASFLLELICLIYLSIVAGKRDDSGEVYLNFFDRIPTELLFLLASVEIIIFVYGFAAVWAHYDSGSYTSYMLLSGGVTFLGMAFLLVFYLSFIRRIRAGVLWMNSILRWFIHGIGLLFTRQKSLTKMVLWFGLHLLACICILPLGGELGIPLFALTCGIEAVLIIREGVQRNKVMDGINKIASGNLEYKISEEELKGDNKKLAQAVNTIGEGLHHAVDKSMKDERLQADLITNVSHDIKTPLTSIINYVDLLKREDLQNERAQNYIKVLDAKSQRLKQLAEDLVEASRISSGNINLDMVRLNLVELIHQTEGEFTERFKERGLTIITRLPADTVVILADGRRIWRVLENLYQNVAKYAMEQTRVYVDLQADGEKVSFSIKNISKNPLNIAADELTERFIRGDISRSTEGSGLGLSIAQNLTTLMGGTFQIYLDGDLFKVMLEFQQEPQTEIIASD